jgi:hypothetical protein
MKYIKEILIIILVATTFFFIGSSNKQDIVTNTSVDSTVVDFETAVKNYPRGSLDIPAQWFLMESLVGWEKMMFIYGYVDDKEVCNHLAEIAKEESPERNFRCEDAN